MTIRLSVIPNLVTTSSDLLTCKWPLWRLTSHGVMNINAHRWQRVQFGDVLRDTAISCRLFRVGRLSVHSAGRCCRCLPPLTAIFVRIIVAAVPLITLCRRPETSLKPPTCSVQIEKSCSRHLSNVYTTFAFTMLQDWHLFGSDRLKTSSVPRKYLNACVKADDILCEYLGKEISIILYLMNAF